MVVLTDLRLISGARLHKQDLNHEGVGPAGTFPSPLKNSRIWTSWLLQIFPNQNLESSKVLAFVTGCWWALLYAEDRQREVPFILLGFHIHQTAPWPHDTGHWSVLHLSQSKLEQVFPSLPLRNMKNHQTCPSLRAPKERGEQPLCYRYRKYSPHLTRAHQHKARGGEQLFSAELGLQQAM